MIVFFPSNLALHSSAPASTRRASLLLGATRVGPEAHEKKRPKLGSSVEFRRGRGGGGLRRRSSRGWRRGIRGWRRGCRRASGLRRRGSRGWRRGCRRGSGLRRRQGRHLAASPSQPLRPRYDPGAGYGSRRSSLATPCRSAASHCTAHWYAENLQD